MQCAELTLQAEHCRGMRKDGQGKESQCSFQGTPLCIQILLYCQCYIVSFLIMKIRGGGKEREM